MKQYSHWLSIPNVVSLAYCEETTPGRDVLRVGVIKKLPQNIIPQGVEFETPKERVKVFVEQVEEGPIVPLGAPYPGGSHLKTDGFSTYGCAAATVTFRGERRLLSAAHVLTNFDEDNIGKKIYLRSRFGDKWEEAGVVSGHINVKCYPTDNERAPEKATQDLAWANVNDKLAEPQCIEWIGEVAKNVRAPRKKEKAKIFGGVSGSKLPTRDPPGKVNVASTQTLAKVCMGPTRYVYFEDVCLLKCDATLAPGDSGSAIVGEEDNAIIGLLISGSKIFGNYYFCKIH